MNKSSFVIILMIASLLSVHEVAAKTCTPDITINNNNEYIIPLAWFNAKDPNPLELYGASPRIDVDFPVSSRLKVTQAKFDVVYTNSISLIPRSQLAVTLDKSVLAQMPLIASQPDNAVRIQLPVRDVTAGFHKIGFRAAQHYTNQCEDSSAPELYSQINTRQSVLSLQTEPRAIEARLDLLDHVYDRRLWLNNYRLNLFIPDNAKGVALIQEAAAQVSQAIAGFFQYVPVLVRVSAPQPPAESVPSATPKFPGFALPNSQDINNKDGVLLGTRDQLKPYISDQLAAEIVGGFIGIYPSDSDPSRAILVVSGVTPEQVLAAATTLNLPGIALPDRNHVLISTLDVPTGYNRTHKMADQPGWTSFANLGFTSTTLQGRSPNPVAVNFWISDKDYILNPSTPFVDLDLHVAYGAGFDQKSGLNVFLNKELIKTIPMADPNGAQLFRVQIRVPTPSIQNGFNQLKLQPTVIGKDVGGECMPIFYDNLLVSVFDDSRINLPHADQTMAIPDLGQFARTGLPYTLSSDASKVGVLLADNSNATLGQALTLVAKIRQTGGEPLFHLGFTASLPASQPYQQLLVVGAESKLPADLRRELTDFMPQQEWQTFDVGRVQTVNLKQGLMDWVQHPTEPLVRSVQTQEKAIASLNLKQGLGRSSAMVQFFSTSLGIPVTLLTAAHTDMLTDGAEALVEDKVWGNLAGAATLWDTDGDVVASAQSTSPTFLGEKPNANSGSMMISNNPWWSLTALLALLAAFATLTWWLLKRRAKRMGVEN